ncbi:sporulation protein YqfC [Cellulosilyticum sp. I15G10I2]|uniref:sporulation protein YqfC n=1 Tax=Cellulosilyticum sp. I15G10I2 TaxID=1892843 RepID=UPI00085BFFB3|nr:sporulation protein YqfC [Cellulosilyticum sp. I15G10I2]
MRRNKKINNMKKENIREQLTEALDIPKEVIIDLPVITLTGNKEINVENFNGLLEYTRQKIRLNTRSGILVIDGIELEAKNMTAERICIKGNILHITFVV